MTRRVIKNQRRKKTAATEQLLTVLILLEVVSQKEAWTAQFLYTFKIYDKSIKDEG